jgi:RNA polymerase sigma-70 factor (ECF subfamily)
MTEPSSQTVQIQGWLDRLAAGDESARKELLNCACERLTRLTRKMLRNYQRVRRWEQTEDVFQNATMRLYRSLGEVKPADVGAFFRLAALGIRRELLDLAKHYYGPQGQGANYASLGTGADSQSSLPGGLEQEAATEDANRLAFWTEFHTQVERLPEEEREIFDLLWYQELSQAEAAALLKVSERTVKRRWQSARLKLHEALGGELPPS